MRNYTQIINNTVGPLSIWGTPVVLAVEFKIVK